VKPHRRHEVDNCKLGPESAGTSGSRLGKSASATGFHMSSKLRDSANEAKPKTPKKSTEHAAPKVIEVYSHLPGTRPRKVTVERRKKWFESLDVASLLLERGITFQFSTWKKGHWLQLEDFDNTEFDIRSPAQWMELGTQTDGTLLPLQAKALRVAADGGGTWEDCTVHGIKDLKDEKGTKHFMVRWSSKDAMEEPVSRLRIIFHGEDPEVFADRIQFAFEALRKTQARIRLNFFVDNMPVDDIQCLDEDQVARVLDLSKNSASLADMPETCLHELVREVNLDFARTMNKISLLHDSQVQKPPGHALDSQDDGVAIPDIPDAKECPGIFDGIDIDDLHEEGENHFEREVPWFSLWPVPEYSFTQTFSSFCFASLYIRNETVTSLCEVSQENLNLMASCIYTNRFHRPMRLEQFKLLEKQAITAQAQKMREAWVVSLQKIILRNFSTVGKGWFSIHETNPDTYRQGKLKKLLAVVRFMMEDSLRYFVLDSVEDYCAGLEGLCPTTVTVEDLRQVSSEFVATPRTAPAIRGGSLELQPPGRPGVPFRFTEETEADLEPGFGLFVMEVKAAEDKNGFVYTAPGEQVVDICGEILDMGVLAMGDISQVEPQIVPQLFKTVVVKKVLNPPEVHSLWVKDRKAQLLEKIQKALPSLGQYLNLFQPYVDLLQLEPADFVQSK
ncbi:unnamed protein product, partial [Polarella glacialis]